MHFTTQRTLARAAVGAKVAIASVIVVTALLATRQLVFAPTNNAVARPLTHAALTLRAHGVSGDSFSQTIPALVPGDSFQEVIDLGNDTGVDLPVITLSTSAARSSVLDTDRTDGLHLVLDSCSRAWTPAEASSAYRCPGAVRRVLQRVPVIQADRVLAGLGSAAAGGVDHLRLTFSLPTTAGNGFQDASSVLRFTVTGSQAE